MTREEITAFFARRQDAFARHDAAALAALHAEDCLYESPWVGRVNGRAAIEQVYRHLFAAFPDVAFEGDELLIDANRTAQVATVVGTDMGGFMGLPPTGKPFRLPLVFLCTLNEHQIVHERTIYDFTGMLVQIGMLKAKPA
jgi:steroid delta-isomerase-like uncharacterized protein